MAERLELDVFSGCVGETFALHATDSTSMDVRLSEAAAIRSERVNETDREPFALVFTGPPEPVLPQRTYRLTHPTAGAHDIFLVPIARTEKGTDYQAVFN